MRPPADLVESVGMDVVDGAELGPAQAAFFQHLPDRPPGAGSAVKGVGASDELDSFPFLQSVDDCGPHLSFVGNRILLTFVDEGADAKMPDCPKDPLGPLILCQTTHPFLAGSLHSGYSTN